MIHNAAGDNNTQNLFSHCRRLNASFKDFVIAGDDSKQTKNLNESINVMIMEVKKSNVNDKRFFVFNIYIYIKRIRIHHSHNSIYCFDLSTLFHLKYNYVPQSLQFRYIFFLTNTVNLDKVNTLGKKKCVDFKQEVL